MHILFVTYYYEPDSGAAANRLTRLAQHLQARGHQVTVLTTMPHYPRGIIPPPYRRRFQVTEDRNGVRVIQVWLFTSPKQRLLFRLLSQVSFMITGILRGLFISRPDVMFIENQPIFAALVGWSLSKIKRVPYLANISDYWPEYLVVAGITSESSPQYRLFKALVNRTQRDAGAIVTLLDDLMLKVENRIGKPANSRVIYNGVNLATFHPDRDDQAFRNKYHLGEDMRLVSFLGILGHHIDLDMMLAVVRHFKDHDNVLFLFVGTGSQREKLLVKLQQAEYQNCRWIEWIDYSEVPSFWAASYITYWALVDNPLDQMRFQAKLYEALASGTPAVIAVRGLMHEVLTQSEIGLTVAPNDTKAFIEAVERLLEDEAYYQYLSARARAYAEAYLDAEKVADAYEDLLQHIANP